MDLIGLTYNKITNAPAREEKELNDYILKVVNREILMRFPQTSGPVLRTQKDNKLWTDFVEENKEDGSNP